MGLNSNNTARDPKGGPLSVLLRLPIVFLYAILLGIALNRFSPLPFLPFPLLSFPLLPCILLLLHGNHPLFLSLLPIIPPHKKSDCHYHENSEKDITRG